MKDKRVAIVENTHPYLLLSPHMTTNLVQFFLGACQLDAAQKEKLTTHLLKCFHCRMTMLTLFAAELGALQHDATIDTLPLQQIIDTLIEIHQEEESRTLEHLGAYAETIVASGQDEAERRFPILSGHIDKCRACQGALKDMLAFLRELP